MAKDRNEILKQFMKNETLLEILKAEGFEFSEESFSKKSDSLLVETMKKMILSYSMGDRPPQILKKMNLFITSELSS